jgi:hypothetical protein
MFVFVESGMCGGLSVISYQYARAYNLYLKPEDYDSSKPLSYIIYLDDNNLHGWVMNQPLPVGGFRFLTDEEISKIDFTQIPDDSDTSYFVECDLEYPAELHEIHNNFRLAPYHMRITNEILSPFCISLGVKCLFDENLIGNLQTEIKYKTHYRSFKLYLSLGMKLLRVHRVLSFKQQAWLKPYVDLNTAKRQMATSKFQGDSCNLVSNAIFGQIIENVRKRRNVPLDDEAKLKNLLAQP